MPVELGERREEEQTRWTQKAVLSQGLPGLLAEDESWMKPLIPRGGHSGMGSRGYQSGQPMCLRDRGYGGGAPPERPECGSESNLLSKLCVLIPPKVSLKSPRAG